MTAAATSPLAALAAENLDRLRAAHPAAFDDRRRLVLGAAAAAAVVGLAAFALWYLDFSILAIWNGVGRLGGFLVLMIPPSPDRYLWTYLQAMAETVGIAYLGTLVAAIIAFPFGFLAARNVIPNVFVHVGVRRFLDTLRGVDTLIWALIWVSVVGLGPFAGVLAIICSDIGAFGKLFSEAIETADRRPVEGVISAGGSRLAGHRFGILPQIVPVMVSQVLYYFESNTRSATIIGIVGAGGIGIPLAEAIRTLELQQVAFLVLMILVVVTVIDLVSSRIRFAVIGKPAH
ncbi:phosphonate ABC transporter, permease protein PhnE [Oharaeibacter diazotrophicus]|uniref:Phosphonate transport system permease protein n=1 Tax=Oharaeibacter diazotrophicus TaxID=1920512 RepID=A0A4R6RHY7_9HYPH|nr:phosphonate ABC transporter, permease protein PhnE [Oharaeibacter diazotrophicus]TDP85286.1 phosphonate transport system permease protein [Oharaeibacter diazotrophicus]BBE74257.1 phosphate-import permease protein PhnE [Pleomorphomonas sp. SM30]GLS76053.1 phosphonate ABC transporter, permease protein PhnE [Oharaeibacter diazotrophicus]